MKRTTAQAIIMGILMILCVGCSTSREQQQVEPAPEFSKYAKMVTLPHLRVSGVDFQDGLTKQETDLVAQDYFLRFINGCGMAESPLDSGEFWCVPVVVGFAPANAGRFWFSKDGKTLLFEPRNGHLSSITRSLLTANGVSYDQTEQKK